MRRVMVAMVLTLVACQAPTIKRKTTVYPMTAVHGVSVDAAPWDTTGWRVLVKNHRGEPIAINWDASSFVTNGYGTGRLIRGATRKLFDAFVQAPSPVPAQAWLAQVVIPETLLDVVVDPREWEDPKRPTERRNNLAPREVTDGVGKLVIAIDSDVGREHVQLGLTFRKPLKRAKGAGK